VSGFSNFQHRAIAWYAKREDLKMTLSAYPIVHFNQPDGTEITRNVVWLTDWYRAELKRLGRDQTNREFNRERYS
jgi:hypothetical protein